MKKPSSSASLRVALTALDETTSRVNGTAREVDTLSELRAWRLKMAKRFIGLSIMPAPAQKEAKR